MIVAEAPGKLFVAGEYAVVEPGRHAVVVAVSRLIRVSVRPARAAEGSSVSSPHFGDRPVPVRVTAAGVSLEAPGGDLVGECIRVVVELAAHRGLPLTDFALDIESELDDVDGRKFGLGSSGAVAVATVDALAQHAALDLDAEQVFRLASLATIELRPAASCADIATSTLGGWVHYASFDRPAVRDLRRAAGVHAALAATWEGLALERLPAPEGLALRVGWTSSPASTEGFVRALQQSDWRSSAEYGTFCSSSDEVTLQLVAALRRGDTPAVLDAVRSAGENIAFLDSFSGIGVLTDELTALVAEARALGLAAKSSGAGGGDCGIAFTAGHDEALTAAWADAGIEALDLHVTQASRRGEHGNE